MFDDLTYLTQSRPPPVVGPLESVGLEKMLRSFLAGQTATEAATEVAPSTATHLTGLERSGVFLMWEVGSCCDSVPRLEGVSIYAAGMAGREHSGGGGGYYDPTPGGDGP